jgi:hypothetical protein
MSDTHKSGRCPSDPRPDPKGRCYGSEGLVVRLKSMLGHHEIRLGPGCERLERFQHTLQYLKIEVQDATRIKPRAREDHASSTRGLSPGILCLGDWKFAKGG